MVKVFRIPVSKEKLKSLSKDERVLFILLGHSVNQMTMLEKLLVLCSRPPQDQLDDMTSGAQGQMLLRLLIGVVNESWELVSTRFLQNPVGKKYLSLIDAEGLKALENLKKQFGGSNLLNRIRTNVAFHQPRSDAVENAFEAAISNVGFDGNWNFFFSQHAYNSLFFLSEIVITQTIFDGMSAADFQSGQMRIIKETTEASQNLNNFAKAFTKSVWLEHFGSEMQSDRVFDVTTAPRLDQIAIPFFVEVPSAPILASDIGI
jgi:hypothetical protein